jgi:integrase
MGKKQSMKYATKKGSLKGITDNHSVKAYNRWCKKFVEWAAEQGVTHFEDLPTEKERIDFVQKYQIYLDNTKGYAPSTVHDYLAPVCKAMGFSMAKIKKKRRTAGYLKRSRDPLANPQGKREATLEKYQRFMTAQRAIGVRRAELSKLTGDDLIERNGMMYVRVKKGKQGKFQLQLILPEDQDKLREIWKGIKPNERVFTEDEVNNKIDLHGVRREHSMKAYNYYVDQINNTPGFKEELQEDLCRRYWTYSKKHGDKDALQKWATTIVYNEKPYELRGENKAKAINAGAPTVYNRLALIAISVYQLSHWRLDVSAVNYTA